MQDYTVREDLIQLECDHFIYNECMNKWKNHDKTFLELITAMVNEEQIKEKCPIC